MLFSFKAATVGIEPTTSRLTAGRSASELRSNVSSRRISEENMSKTEPTQFVK